jgi:Uma2 family endonuclease
VRRSRWERLSTAEREGFPPLCPDFVAELRSPSDDLSALQAKLEEYMANGAQLGWLIDPDDRRVYVYRPNTQMECLDHPTTLSGAPVPRGFSLDSERLG